MAAYSCGMQSTLSPSQWGLLRAAGLASPEEGLSDALQKGSQAQFNPLRTVGKSYLELLYTTLEPREVPVSFYNVEQG